MHDEYLPERRELLRFESGKPLDVSSIVGYLSLLAEGKDIDPGQLSKQIENSLKNNNISRGLDFLSQGMGHNEGAKAQRLLNRLIGFAQGSYPTTEYDKHDLMNDFQNVTGISIDSPAKANSFDDLLDQFCFKYNAGQLRGLDR
jgi:hypothetical protein